MLSRPAAVSPAGNLSVCRRGVLSRALRLVGVCLGPENRAVIQVQDGASENGATMQQLFGLGPLAPLLYQPP